MNIEKNTGITLIALVITVILLIIITGVTINFGVNITGTAQFENIETALITIQSKCKILAEKKAIGDIEEDALYGTKVTEENSEYKGWYLLSQEDLNDIGAKKMNAKDGFYVDYDNDDVAYAKGVTYNGQTYYKLSEMQRLKED